MRILVYEFVTGGGWYSAGHGESLPASLLAEGAAMAQALVADLSQLADVTVEVLRDRRLASLDFAGATVHEVASATDERTALAARSAAADWSIVIAPEFDGHLARRARWVEQSGGRSLGPGQSLIELASDKHLLAEYLAERGVPVARGVALDGDAPLPRDFRYPAVLKPRDGAGSIDVQFIPNSNARLSRVAGAVSHRWRLETYLPGQAASVVCLCGPREVTPLAPCGQTLSTDGRFRYLGGTLPLDPPLAERARRLAVAAVVTLGAARGYVGVDLVLGADEEGREDYVLEINPRWTTSYVGLRRLARGNLAEWLMAIALGRAAQVGWHEGHVTFEATGRVRYSPADGGSVDPVNSSTTHSRGARAPSNPSTL